MTEQKLTKARDLRDSRPLWIDSLNRAGFTGDPNS